MAPGDLVKDSGNASGGRVMGMAVFQHTEIHQRDAFISWIRAEFAAANAIIDALCNHLRSVGEPGDYDSVLACIQQRRYNWITVLQMQQYYSVADVAFALEQVVFRKHQATNSNGLHNSENFVEINSVSSETDQPEIETGGVKDEEAVVRNGGDDVNENGKELARSGNDHSNIAEKHKGSLKERCSNGDSLFLLNQEEDWQRQARIKAAKSFVANELVDGHLVNVIKGLKLYENIFDSLELSRLTFITHELHVAGQQGKLRGQTFMASKRPLKGNGREVIQFGVPIISGQLKEETTNETLKASVEPIPAVLQALIDRLLQWNLIPGNRRPDCCIIDFFNEGDYSQLHTSPPHFERPFCTLSLLSECTMVFGRVIATEHPGDYKGSFKLSLPAGSLLVMQGNSVDVARHAICSSPRKRITITLAKVQPKKAHNLPSFFTGIPHSPRLSMAPWSVSKQSSANTPLCPHSPGRAINPATPKHYNHNALPASGVLPVPLMPQHASATGIRPLFASMAGHTGAYPPMAVLAPGWSAVPRPSRLPSPGTGVFLPCSESVSNPGWPVALPRQQQGVLVPSHLLPKSDPTVTEIASVESPGSSHSTKRSSKSTSQNKSVHDHLDKSSENSNSLSSLGSMDSNVPAKDAAKDIMNGNPKLESNGNVIIKDDQGKRTSSWSKTTGNKANSITAGGRID
eukprot:Gb_10066 [translate_table: standard]